MLCCDASSTGGTSAQAAGDDPLVAALVEAAHRHLVELHAVFVDRPVLRNGRHAKVHPGEQRQRVDANQIVARLSVRQRAQ